MNRMTELHEKAMEASDEAFFARRRGDVQAADTFARQAFELEVAAAHLVRDDFTAEPTRSILYRSAASMALECKEFREAERLIAIALAGDPPDDIVEELRELLEQVHFDWHLEVRGIGLEAGAFQFSITGEDVGYGMTRSDIFVDRIENIKKLIYRFIERKLGKEFRERGTVERSIQEGYSLYMATPQPGSFAVTLRLGRQLKLPLPGIDLSGEIINEFVDCLSLVNVGEEEKLREVIPQEPYYRNFVNLARNIAPDGKDVKMVGFTTKFGGQEKRVALTRRRSEIKTLPSSIEDEQIKKPDEMVQLTGRLVFADAEKDERKIKLKPDNDKSYTVIVPEGMMNDIVRPLWDDIVVVTGTRVRNKIHLNDIYRAL